MSDETNAGKPSKASDPNDAPAVDAGVDEQADAPQDPTPADVAVTAEESTTPTGEQPTAADTTVAEVPAEPEPVQATTDPAAAPVTEGAASTSAAQQVIYVTAPAAPARKGNRGIGALIAAASALIFAVLLAIATLIIGALGGRPLSFAFLLDGRFYIPVLFFAIGFVLLVLIVNRAAWWAYILGSLAVAVFVYFGTIGVGLLSTGIILDTPSEAAARYAAALRDPFIIVSALLAREVSMWVGAAIASRGRKVKARNLEAQAAYERELAERRAEHERANGAR